jgi:serine/threonine protein kinase/WD40 repeat protein
MTLNAGTLLGPYEITAAVGAGGMGEVYRATDTKLKREVAIKVLPEDVARDPERLARFEREAELLAALNHPNIGHIYGLEEKDAVMALVLELVEGPTLAERIAQGPLPLEEALPIATQIAAALEAAHERGIVHRDLKPANVKVKADGTVKVLDFGLAKALGLHSESGDPSFSHSPTAAAATGVGTILGTAAYMAPEQARGKSVDKRADIWAFGCVLAEMLTGRRVFGEETVAETLAAVLKTEPDHSTLVTTASLGIRRLIARCLRKDPGQRLHDIADARLEIEAVVRGDDSEGVTPGPDTAPAGSGPWKVVAALASVVALTALATHLSPSAPPPSPYVGSRLALRIPPSDTYSVLQNCALALSPDGRTLAYAAKPSDPSAFSEIYLQRFDSFEPESVPDTQRGYSPFFSPDGQWLGYFQDTGMWKKPVRGGPATKLAPVAGMARGASWDDQDQIFYAPTWFSPIFRVSADGGPPTQVTTLLEGEKSHRFPSALPDGSAVVFTVSRADTDSFDDASIAIQRVGSSEKKVLVEDGSFGLFLPPNGLLYGRRGSLFFARLDVEHQELLGAPAPVIDDLLTSPNFGSAQLGVSASGTLAYLAGSPALFNSRAVEVSRTGEITDLPVAAKPYSMVQPSPDGTQLAMRIDGANGQIWVYDVARGTLSRLTREWDADFPAWHPDGESLAFVLSKGEFSQIARVRADGSGEPETLWSGGANVTYLDWAPDGRSLVFSDVDPDTGTDLWILDLHDEPSASPYLQTPAEENDAVVSPDGSWLAYTSNQSGRSEIYVQAYPSPGRRWQISAQGGTGAVWSPADGELLFKNGDEIMAVPVELGAGFSAGIPRSLFKLPNVSRGDDTRSAYREMAATWRFSLPRAGSPLGASI